MIKQAYDDFRSEQENINRLNNEAKGIQKRIDQLVIEANNAYLRAITDFEKKLDALKLLVTDGYVRPAVIKLSFDEAVIAIGDDKLWVSNANGEHTFGPPDKRGHRNCEECSHSISWRSEPLAVLDEALP